MVLLCDACGRQWLLTPERIWCECGAPLRWASLAQFDPSAIEPREWSLWRYRAMLLLPEGIRPVSLGEGVTPLVSTPDGQSWLKLEFLNPTGSFKDRGACMLVTALKAWGIAEVAEDSSGNAGVALATYAKAANIRCHIFVPSTASQGKIAALQRFSAHIVFCATRQEAAEEVREAVSSGIYYASHTWHPLYLQGTKTVAYEIAEQLDWRVDHRFTIFVPVGNGDLLLGIHLGFQELLSAGVIKGMPRLIAIQALACAPIYAAAHGLSLPLGTTIAEGVAVTNPPRVSQIIAALQATNGDVVAVSEPAILNAVDELAGLGIWVEPTGALAWAGWTQLGKPPLSVLLLTGAGWKTLRP
ncbi:MAG: hypothetical protein C4295_08540 [Candidatus Fervidibacterota bacterium]